MSEVQRFERVSRGAWRPECVICKESVSLEESKADEYGQAVHQECYLSKLTKQQPMSVFHHPFPLGRRTA